jgi:RNA polymerase sigma-70 factor (ECF subfamily)
MKVMEPEALGRLLDEQAAALVLYARQWCAAPEDVVQEAFLKLSAQPRPPQRPVPWLYRVVRNAAISAGRADRRRRRHEGLAAARSPAWFTHAEPPSLDAEAVAEALRALPPDEREVIVAHLWGGLSFEQIAELVNSSSSTAHRRYAAGLSALRERLKVPCPNRRPIAR